MEQVTRSLSIFALTFLVMLLAWNVNRKLPRVPVDIYIEKFGFGIYIPIISAVVISVLITIFLNMTRQS